MLQHFSRSLPVGAYCDLVTPFADGTVDTDALELLVKWQISNGIRGLVVCGQAGEPTSLTWAERRAVISAAVVAAAGRVPVLVGTGTTSTETTRANTIAARELGADAAVIVTPYYSKPGQKGLIRHFETIAAVVDIPIIICNAPGATACDISSGTLDRLATLPNVAGLQDCAGDMGRLDASSQIVKARLRHYSGDDRTSLAFNLMGGSGTFSIAANIAPRLVSSLHDAIGSGDIRSATALHARLQPVFDVLTLEPAIPVAKQALSLLHGLSSATRLPLTEVDETTAKSIESLLDMLPRNSGLPKVAEMHR